ncbi:hypothetical protein GCM10027404_22130 [Arthrobacter tumbae]|uniref:ROK family protein n=1 Tax=Arthrobacter tumbae TaxID=163874 RepID=UPI001956B1E2|nr:ROK family protein [Arthrobacter tumbae]MBM7781898.1 putative NBD/HSP70 family sugar kinase [Arthrobacter tumbae]
MASLTMETTIPTPLILSAGELRRQTDVLAVALSNLRNEFNPQVIVLGRFLGVLFAAAGHRPTEAVDADSIGDFGGEVRLERAALGNDMLLVGAAEAVFRQLTK